MTSQLLHLLSAWYGERNSARWVLGTVYETRGSSYRKAGAMMLFGDQGQQLGLLSGGCLEADIHRRARQVMDTGKSALVTYDGNDEDDLSFQLGIGCGGVVRILLQPMDADHLSLPRVLNALELRQSGVYRQLVSDRRVAAEFIPGQGQQPAGLYARGRLVEVGNETWLETPVFPAPHLLVVGGGLDARPVAAMARQLGWRVSLCDPRPANARQRAFPDVDLILRTAPEALADEPDLADIDAAIVMSHNLKLDAGALQSLARLRPRYLALIGPLHRKAEVLAMAGMEEAQLGVKLSTPAGLDIGAELPEGIALSLLAECHGVLAGAAGGSLSAPERARRPINRPEG